MFAYIVIIVLGLAAGSFFNVCISRIPEERSIIFPPSHCPECGAKIKAVDLIPIISWFMLRGRCRSCMKPISFRYPIVEALTAAVFAVLYFHFGLSVNFVFSLVFASLLILISFIDIEHLMIPYLLMLAGIAVGIAYSLYNGIIIDSLTGISFGFVFMYLLGEGARFFLKKEALGEGDVKLMVMLGSFLGLRQAFISMAFGSMTGAVVGLILISAGMIKREDQIPFGPFLALGAIVSILIW
jgi:leader peptidase (prepilin peptidase)/N-methyltransferase